MGGGEILRMIIADQKSYLNQKNESHTNNRQSEGRKNRDSSASKPPTPFGGRNKPRDINDLDKLVMNAFDEQN